MQPAPTPLPAVVSLSEHQVPSRISSRLPLSPCSHATAASPRQSAQQTDGLCPCLALPLAPLYQEQRQRLHAPQFAADRGYNLTADTTLNSPSPWSNNGGAFQQQGCLSPGPTAPARDTALAALTRYGHVAYM